MKLFSKLIAAAIAALMLAQGCAFADTGKVIFAVDLVRHGDRTPGETLPKGSLIDVWAKIDHGIASDPSTVLGQLTPTGMNQELNNLGVPFHNYYVGPDSTTKLLPANYTPGTIYVRSSDYDRTLMSAEAVLMGMYPNGTGPNMFPVTNPAKPALPNNFQEIPVHTVPQADDSLFLYNNMHKDWYAALMQANVFNKSTWNSRNEAEQTNLKNWEACTGMALNGNIANINGLTDNILIRKVLSARGVQGVVMPSCISATDATNIINLGNWVLGQELASKAVAGFVIDEMLQNVVDYMTNAAAGKEGSLKYVMYSGHDTDVSSMMTMLDAPLMSNTIYSANVRFELVQKDGADYVRTSYKVPGKDREYLHLGACPTTSDLCPLATFAKIRPAQPHPYPGK